MFRMSCPASPCVASSWRCRGLHLDRQRVLGQDRLPEREDALDTARGAAGPFAVAARRAIHGAGTAADRSRRPGRRRPGARARPPGVQRRPRAARSRRQARWLDIERQGRPSLARRQHAAREGVADPARVLAERRTGGREVRPGDRRDGNGLGREQGQAAAGHDSADARPRSRLRLRDRRAGQVPRAPRAHAQRTRRRSSSAIAA